MLENSWVAERLVASQEGLSFEELVMFFQNGDNHLPDYIITQKDSKQIFTAWKQEILVSGFVLTVSVPYF
jgi:hypothetical protein